jgi:hypothetical protein
VPSLKQATVLHDTHSLLMTMIESGTLFKWLLKPSTRPHYERIDYNHIGTRGYGAAANSTDLITVSMGLHHFNVDNRSNFLEWSLHTLRPGGLLMIREHDANNDIMPMCDMAHTIFNAGTRVTEAEEASEIRDFKPVEHWRIILANAGFEVTMVYNIQSTDPTEDVMIIARKPPVIANASSTTSHDVTLEANEAIASNQSRDIISNRFTPSEWYVVHSIKKLGVFLNREPFYRYPFMNELRHFWRSYSIMFRQSCHQYGIWRTITNEGFGATLTVGVITSSFYTAMAAVSAPIKMLLGSSYSATNRMSLVVTAPIPLGPILRTLQREHTAFKDVNVVPLLDEPVHVRRSKHLSSSTPSGAPLASKRVTDNDKSDNKAETTGESITKDGRYLIDTSRYAGFTAAANALSDIDGSLLDCAFVAFVSTRTS